MEKTETINKEKTNNLVKKRLKTDLTVDDHIIQLFTFDYNQKRPVIGTDEAGRGPAAGGVFGDVDPQLRGRLRGRAPELVPVVQPRVPAARGRPGLPQAEGRRQARARPFRGASAREPRGVPPVAPLVHQAPVPGGHGVLPGPALPP